MKYAHIVIILAFIILTACREEPWPTGNTNLSEITEQSEWLAPLYLYNDLNEDFTLNQTEHKKNKARISLSEAGFYTIYKSNGDSIRFVVYDKERGELEWGLPKHAPEFVASSSIESTFEIMHPKNWVQGLNFPIAVREINWTAQSGTNLSARFEDKIWTNVKAGMGSGWVQLNSESKAHLQIGNQAFEIEANKLENPDFTWTSAPEASINIPDNSMLAITKNIEIKPDIEIIFNPGTIVLISPGVTITVNGKLTFNGTSENPIWVGCSKPSDYFGGFILNDTRISAQHTFFTQFGKNTGEGFSYGHAKRQALIHGKKSIFEANNCYFMNSPGQVFFMDQSLLKLQNCLVQRVKTGGQANYGEVRFTSCYFSDFPDDTPTFRDEDNDAYYLLGSNASIENSAFMYAKDDGIDSGGEEGGTISVHNCRFEACFHEGLALSSGNQVKKVHHISDCTFRNCQQGVELGYSSPNHIVTVQNCIFDSNIIGVRYGDNYKRAVEGQMHVDGCTFENNTKSTWNMLRANWMPQKEKLFLSNCYFK